MSWTAAEVASVISAAAAVIALFFVGTQIRYAARSVDLQAIQSFLNSVKVAEAQLAGSSTDAERRSAFFEYLDLLEANALALRRSLYPKASRDLVTNKLVGAIATLHAAEDWHGAIQSAMRDDSVFTELRWFEGRYESDIKARAAVESWSPRQDSNPRPLRS